MENIGGAGGLKKLIALTTLSAFLFVFVGCAGTLNPTLDPSYVALKTLEIQQEQKPLFEFELDTNGKVKSFKGYERRSPVVIEQPRPHPIWAVTTSLIKVAGIVGGIWAIGDAMEGVVKASNGNSTNINSANDNSSNEGSIDSGYTITDTVTTDNSTQ